MERRAKVGDYLYMWGGWQPGLPEVHDSEEKKSMSSVIAVECARMSERLASRTRPLPYALSKEE